ncbi:MAG TPA: hypothetical protein DCL41_03410 [Bdellovibrionales bacterium]|nr:hypothetical protein [Pseudobdellovibrionaceae bacterium]HAG90888.1 hypothetical protein [Bdellovibrionales bacterium]
MNSFRIDNCYDSHVHWLATGDFAERLSLSALSNPNEILNLSLPEGNWIFGYGWSVPFEAECSIELLDQWCKERPVALSKSDGHSLWVNSKALELSGISKDAIAKTGVLKEKDRDRVLKSIPEKSSSVILRQLMKAQKIFHESGITHIRDVHMKESQFMAAKHLEDSGLLKLAVEAFVFDESLNHNEKIQLAKSIKGQISQGSLIRLCGVKIFLDGSLGSETAALSEDYLSGSGKGTLFYSEEELAQMISDCWKEGLEVAIHTIGDAAVDRSCRALRNLAERGLHGVLHLEHVELMDEKNVRDLKDLKVTCHMQPGHWLDDQKWLDQKLSANLKKRIFPWRKLQEAEVPFYFGSDSPLSTPGIFRIQQALEDAQQNGLPRLLGNFQSYLSHPDRSWPANTFTEFENGQVKTLHFAGEPI